jgi:hypothetical protein
MQYKPELEDKICKNPITKAADKLWANEIRDQIKVETERKRAHLRGAKWISSTTTTHSLLLFTCSHIYEYKGLSARRAQYHIQRDGFFIEMNAILAHKAHTLAGVWRWLTVRTCPECVIDNFFVTLARRAAVDAEVLSTPRAARPSVRRRNCIRNNTQAPSRQRAS